MWKIALEIKKTANCEHGTSLLRQLLHLLVIDGLSSDCPSLSCN